MLYESQIDEIWKIINGGDKSTIKGPVPSRATYLQVICMIFCQTDGGPSSEHLAVEITSCLAERRLWVYYFGDDIPFPGVDPRVDPKPAITNKLQLLTRWQNQHYREGYTPQFGWDPKTGRPWFAYTCFAEQAYPALCGRDQAYLHELHRLTPNFVLRYERMGQGQDGSVLLWPEFKRKEDITKLDRQAQFNYLRAFLSEWTSSWGEWSNGSWRVPISEAFIQFQERSQQLQQALPLPGGFSFDLAFPHRQPQISSEPQTPLRPLPNHGTPSLPPRAKRPSSHLQDESESKRRRVGMTDINNSRGVQARSVENIITNITANKRPDVRTGGSFGAVGGLAFRSRPSTKITDESGGDINKNVHPRRAPSQDRHGGGGQHS